MLQGQKRGPAGRHGGADAGGYHGGDSGARGAYAALDKMQSRSREGGGRMHLIFARCSNEHVAETGWRSDDECDNDG